MSQAYQIARDKYDETLPQTLNHSTSLYNRRTLKTTKNLFTIVEQFEAYLTKQGYAFTTRRSILQKTSNFVNFVCLNSSTIDPPLLFKGINRLDIDSYEKELMNKHDKGVMSMSSVYLYLRSMKIFLDFLNKLRIIRFHYQVASSIQQTKKRDNEYVSVDEIVAVLEQIVQHNKFKLRDLCIVLLHWETGCRPIEIAGLTVEDVRVTESLIAPYSQKSGQRTLKISAYLKNILKEYLKHRITLGLQHQSLFYNCFGFPLSNTSIRNIFQKASLRAFGEYRVTAKALRHTFATNALENNNEFRDVSKAMGHRRWVSTYFYLHKSVQRLVSNSIDHNPIDALNLTYKRSK